MYWQIILKTKMILFHEKKKKKSFDLSLWQWAPSPVGEVFLGP
jgi:hypothetical protein